MVAGTASCSSGWWWWRWVHSSLASSVRTSSAGIVSTETSCPPTRCPDPSSLPSSLSWISWLSCRFVLNPHLLFKFGAPSFFHGENQFLHPVLTLPLWGWPQADQNGCQSSQSELLLEHRTLFGGTEPLFISSQLLSGFGSPQGTCVARPPLTSAAALPSTAPLAHHTTPSLFTAKQDEGRALREHSLRVTGWWCWRRYCRHITPSLPALCGSRTQCTVLSWSSVCC